MRLSPFIFKVQSFVVFLFEQSRESSEMGLCKCPKKAVTTLFCYEHRVNVCESCLVSNHPSCVIQSYFKWLQDADYDPKCPLCSAELSVQECIRLICFHVFHWKCFRNHLVGYPKTTAPAGYKCPTCSLSIMPNPHLVSPVADELRKKIVALGLCDTVGDSDPIMKNRQDATQAKPAMVGEHRLHSDPKNLPPVCYRASLDFNSLKNHRHSKPQQSTSLYTIEEDSGKYRRRRPMTLRQSLNYLRRSPYCKFVFLIFFTLFVLGVMFVTVIPKEFEDERAFKRIVQLKERAYQQSHPRLEVTLDD